MKKVLFFVMALVTAMAMLSATVMAAPLQGTDDLEGSDKQWQISSGNVVPSVVGDDNAKYFYDDMTGFMRGNFIGEPDWIGYEVASGTIAVVTTNYWPNEPIKGTPDNFIFLTSADGETWTELAATSKIEMNTIQEGGDVNDLTQRKWDIVTYTTSAVPQGHKYLKIQWPGGVEGMTLTQPWGQRVHSITIKEAEAPAQQQKETTSNTTKSNPKTGDGGVVFSIITLVTSSIVAGRYMKRR